MRESLLTTYEIEQAPPVSFLIQAGYLTFKEWDSELGYLVDYPNKEVRDSISHLVIMGTYGIDEWVQDELKNNIIAGLREGDFEKIFGQMKRTLAAIPYNLYEQRESYYHSVILTLLRATGIDAAAEEITNLGRSDIVIRYRDHVYVLELKRGRAEEALKQIRSKGYAEKYCGKKVTLVGVEIDEEKSNLNRYVAEKV